MPHVNKSYSYQFTGSYLLLKSIGRAIRKVLTQDLKDRPHSITSFFLFFFLGGGGGGGGGGVHTYSLIVLHLHACISTF